MIGVPQSLRSRLSGVGLSGVGAASGSAVGPVACQGIGHGRRLAERLQEAVARELGFDVACGLAGSRITAQLASRLSRPRGLLYVLPGYEARLIAPLDVGLLPDPPRHASAAAAGRRHHARCARRDAGGRAVCLGSRAATFCQWALGVDPRPVDGALPPRSLAREVTFADADIDDSPRRGRGAAHGRDARRAAAAARLVRADRHGASPAGPARGSDEAARGRDGPVRGSNGGARSAFVAARRGREPHLDPPGGHGYRSRSPGSRPGDLPRAVATTGAGRHRRRPLESPARRPADAALPRPSATRHRGGRRPPDAGGVPLARRGSLPASQDARPACGRTVYAGSCAARQPTASRRLM